MNMIDMAIFVIAVGLVVFSLIYFFKKRNLCDCDNSCSNCKQFCNSKNINK